MLLHGANFTAPTLERIDAKTGASLLAWDVARKDRLEAVAIDGTGRMFTTGYTDDPGAGYTNVLVSRYVPIR